MFSQNFECLIRVTRHVQLAMDRAENSEICSDDKGGPLAWQRAEAFHAEQLSDAPVRVGEEGESQVVLLIKFHLPTHRIGADPHALGTEFRELARQVTKVTALDRSTLGHRFGIEEQGDWAIL